MDRLRYCAQLVVLPLKLAVNYEITEQTLLYNEKPSKSNSKLYVLARLGFQATISQYVTS